MGVADGVVLDFVDFRYLCVLGVFCGQLGYLVIISPLVLFLDICTKSIEKWDLLFGRLVTPVV